MTSKAITPLSSNFVKRLTAAGVIPHQCRSMILTVETNQVIRMQLEVLVTGEQMEEIVAALEANPEEAQRIARDIIFREPISKRTAEVKLP
jgi:hypothetical protein